ncbi:MAG: hypothetical protein IJX00_04275 [Clostridia bacterium]|nr:hypothetical protein [Clostridia bacterium]
MKIRKPKTHKKCPRCGNKCLMAQKECEECGLVFSRLQYTSNKAAKKKLRKFDTDFIIYTNQYPNDLTWWKVLLMTFFTGIFGGHYYYTGKYIKGGLMSTSFVYLIFAVVFNAEWSQKSETYLLYLPIGIAGIAWMVSLVYVAFKKYKVPVIVEIPEQEVLDKKVEYDRNEVAKNDGQTTEVVVEATDEKLKKKSKKTKKKQSTEVENEETKTETTVEAKEDAVVEAKSEEIVSDDTKEEVVAKEEEKKEEE